MKENSWLYACAALAAGEGIAASVPTFADAWPAVAVLFLLVSLFGYGFAVPGWRYVTLALFGCGLFFVSSLEREETYRTMPWLRGRKGKAVACARASPLARDLSRRVGLGLGHDRAAADLNRAILLGERRNLPWETRRAFVDSGTIHVFAISGLHVMTVANVLVSVLVLLTVPVRWAGLAAIPILWGYVSVIGSPPSAVRAATMVTFQCLAPVFWRRPNAVMAWSLTFLIVHVLSPRMIADVGCALSFAVMLAIVLAGRFVRWPEQSWRMRLWITFAAWAAGVPIAAHVFGRVTPGGMLANIPLLFAAKFSVTMGTLGVLTSFLSETVAAHLNNLSALFTRTMVGLSNAVAALPFANFNTGEWSLAKCAAWYAVLVLVLYLVRSVRSRHLI